MRMSIKDRVTYLLVGCTLLVLAVWLVAFRSFERFRLDGPEDRDLARYQSLETDVVGPPLFLVEAGMHLHRVALSSDPGERESNWSEFVKHRRGFDSAIAFHDSALQNAPVLDDLHRALDPMKKFLESLDASFVPLMKAGDQAGMIRFLNTEYEPAHRMHDSLNGTLTARIVSFLYTKRIEAGSVASSRVRLTLVLFLVFLGLMASMIWYLRKELQKSVVFERLASNAPTNLMMTDLDLNVTYANRRSIETLKTLEYAMPCKAEEIVGKCIDMFHKNPGRVRKILADPANLPHTATIQVGNDWMKQTVVAVRDEKGRYIGPMMSWELVTRQLETEAKTRQLQKDLADRVAELQLAASDLDTGSEQILASSRATARAAGSTAVSVENLDRQISVVAASAEEMSASVGEIARHVAEATQVAKEAGRTTATVNSRIKDLGMSSAEISRAVGVINDIADQTKLLALNATIEAARAGEAGKGFAVVAGEVKELAKQTGTATEEIGKMVENIQRDVSSSIEAMGKVREVVERIEVLQTSVAAAVEQQNATSGEIARSVGESSEATRTIRSSIQELSKVSESGAGTAEQSKSRSADVASLADRISQAMAAFAK